MVGELRTNPPALMPPAAASVGGGGEGMGGGMDEMGAAFGMEEAKAMRRVVEALDAKLTRKLQQIDERLGKRERSRDPGEREKTRNGTRSRPPGGMEDRRGNSASMGMVAAPPAEAAAPTAVAQQPSPGERRRSRTHSRQPELGYSNGSPGDLGA